MEDTSEDEPTLKILYFQTKKKEIKKNISGLDFQSRQSQNSLRNIKNFLTYTSPYTISHFNKKNSKNGNVEGRLFFLKG